MNVEETKYLILRRLDELREMSSIDGGLPTRPHAAAKPAPPRRSRWRRHDERKVPSSTEQRLSDIEERLAAIERSFLTDSAAQRRGAKEALAKATASLASELAAGVTDSALGQSSATAKPDFDFEGQPYRLTGNVKDGLMTDVLQLLAANQKSGRFALFLPEAKERYDLYFQDGELIHASAGELVGEAAFFALMFKGHEQGFYGFLEGELHRGEPSIKQKTQFLILDALRRIDEERNGGADA